MILRLNFLDFRFSFPMMTLLLVNLSVCLAMLIHWFLNSLMTLNFFVSVFFLQRKAKLFITLMLLALPRCFPMSSFSSSSFSDVDKMHYLLQNFKPEFFSRNEFIKHVYDKLWRRTHFTKPFVRYHAGQYWDKALDAGRFAQCTLLEELS